MNKSVERDLWLKVRLQKNSKKNLARFGLDISIERSRAPSVGISVGEHVRHEVVVSAWPLTEQIFPMPKLPLLARIS
jgi:hypothetical protein